jgi:DNA-binding response OmpR family regulator
MRGYEILLVDDDPFILKTIGATLKNNKYQVTTAQTGEQALERIGQKDFDLVITDLVMGTVDGITVLKAAKQRNSETMVIILTGYGAMDSAIDALRLSADDYLLKPCEPEEITLKVGKSLDRLAMRRKIKVYEDLLAVCCICKKIRDDTGKEKGSGVWMTLEDYLYHRAGLKPTSTYCPDCAEKAKEEFDREKDTDRSK